MDSDNHTTDKIDNLKRLLSSNAHLDRSQLSQLFHKEGFSDISDKAVDQIFDQLDEEDCGYISSDQLLTIIKSLEESSETSELMSVTDLEKIEAASDSDDDGVDHSKDTTITFSSSPTLYSEMEHHNLTPSMSSSADINLFSSVDPSNSGYVKSILYKTPYKITYFSDMFWMTV